MSTQLSLDNSSPPITTSNNFRPYSNYGDPGVDWLGKIPISWGVAPLKAAIRFCRNGVWGDDPDGENDIACIRVADFDRFRAAVHAHDPTLRSVPPRHREGRLLRKGDLLLEKSGGGERQPVGFVVRVESLKTDAVCSNFIARMPVQDGFSAGFLRYVFLHLYDSRVNTRSIKQTTGIQNLDSTHYLDTLFPVPEIATQRGIAGFLDRMTDEIEDLIVKKERLVELLEEKRTALITHAVTKGLDPDVPMKDSGVEWLGEIPAHWDVTRFRYCADIRQGQVDPRDEKQMAKTLISPDHVEPRTGRIIAEVTAVEQRAISGKYAVRSGELIYSKIRPELTKVCISRGEWLCSADMYPVRPRSHMDTTFLLYYLLSHSATADLVTRSMRVAMPKVNRDTLGALPVAIPPRSEQQRIAKHLEKSTGRLDHLKGQIRAVTACLHEYRSALITAAVTGKIDVREHAA